jgi:hypothetical protein
MRASTPVPELPAEVDAVETEPQRVGVRASTRTRRAAAPPPTELSAKRARQGEQAPPLVLPDDCLVEHSASGGRLFTSSLSLQLSEEHTNELERRARVKLNRPAGLSEPPAYSWIKQKGKKAIEAHWEAHPCLLRLLSLSDAVAAAAAKELGMRAPAGADTAFFNVWEPGAREEICHDDGDKLLTVLLRLRSVEGSGVLEFSEGRDAGPWHRALADGDTICVMAPQLAHRVSKSGGAEARLTLVSLHIMQRA